MPLQSSQSIGEPPGPLSGQEKPAQDRLATPAVEGDVEGLHEADVEIHRDEAPGEREAPLLGQRPSSKGVDVGRLVPLPSVLAQRVQGMIEEHHQSSRSQA